MLWGLLVRLWKRYHRLEHVLEEHHSANESVLENSEQLDRTLKGLTEHLDAMYSDRRVARLDRRHLSRPTPPSLDRRAHIRRASDG